MTDSSTSKKSEDKAGSNTAEGKTVPVEAIGEARAKTRAANERAEHAEAELSKTKATQISAEDVQTIVETANAEARKLAQAEVAPLKAEAAKFKLAMKMGLSEEQVDKVMDIKTQNPNLTDDQALTLAKAGHADLFSGQSRGFVPSLHGGLPISGMSPMREQSAAPDYLKRIAEAKQKGDRGAVTELTRQLVQSTYKAQFERARPL